MCTLTFMSSDCSTLVLVMRYKILEYVTNTKHDDGANIRWTCLCLEICTTGGKTKKKLEAQNDSLID